MVKKLLHPKNLFMRTVHFPQAVIVGFIMIHFFKWSLSIWTQILMMLVLCIAAYTLTFIFRKSDFFDEAEHRSWGLNFELYKTMILIDVIATALVCILGGLVMKFFF